MKATDELGRLKLNCRLRNLHALSSVEKEKDISRAYHSHGVMVRLWSNWKEERETMLSVSHLLFFNRIHSFSKQRLDHKAFIAKTFEE